jgi:hypothetical protein
MSIVVSFIFILPFFLAFMYMQPFQNFIPHSPFKIMLLVEMIINWYFMHG